jgi:hypothetical protein
VNLPAFENCGVVIHTIPLANCDSIPVVVTVVIDCGVEVVTVGGRANTVLVVVGATADWSRVGGEQKCAHHHEEREAKNQSHSLFPLCWRSCEVSEYKKLADGNTGEQYAREWQIVNAK